MDNELEQMSPNQRHALDAGLAALDTMAATWAADVGLHEIAAKFAAIADPNERATRIAAMIRQGFTEGAYRHYIDHKDAIAQTVANLARMAELEAQTSDMKMLRAEVARLNAIINSPQSGDFLRAVSTEAEHQRQRWGSEHDAGKTNADWNALVAYLLAKALIAMATGDREKSEHHVITAAAALKNWHASVTGLDNAMRPGYADGGHPGLEQGEPA